MSECCKPDLNLSTDRISSARKALFLSIVYHRDSIRQEVPGNSVTVGDVSDERMLGLSKLTRDFADLLKGCATVVHLGSPGSCQGPSCPALMPVRYLQFIELGCAAPT